MSHLFISYSKKNRAYARNLADALIQNGFDVWIDDRIDYGDNWERTMFKAIDDCVAFLIVMTPESYESVWVQRECHHAEKRKKPPFPLLLDGEEFPRYGLTQYVNVKGGTLPPDDFYERLARFAVRKTVPGREVTDHAAQEPKTGERAPENRAIQQVTNKRIPQDAKSLLNTMQDLTVLPFERAQAGLDLSKGGDPRKGVGVRQDGIPDIDWVKIPGGSFFYQDGEQLSLPEYYIARYPITYAQFQAFIDAQNGYRNHQWWQGLSIRQAAPGEQALKFGNFPRENVSWYDAVAFCRWLSACLSYEIRLPTDAEWEKAARGTDGRQYPWGKWYLPGYANTNEQLNENGSFLMQTSTVGIYPQGASPFGALDMSGNVWEWCASLSDDPDSTMLDEMGARILRGGSWFNSPESAATFFRAPGDPDGRTPLVGFRVARSASTSP